MYAVETSPVLQATSLEVSIRQIRAEASRINSYELISTNGVDLPAFTAGAHIDVTIEPGLVRQYSLSNNPSERHRYVIGVLKDEKGRGGSRRLHETLTVNQRLQISAPRNHFELATDLDKAILLAGGIGITPLKSMAHALAERGIDFELHYCVRQTDSIAFRDELKALQRHGTLNLHVDGGNPAQGLDITKQLATPAERTHVYYCGPQGFMQACAAASAHWPADQVHFEHFTLPAAQPAPQETSEDQTFVVQIASTGQTLVVSPDQTLTNALQDIGVTIPTSCESGLCGTCITSYSSGEVHHHDVILSETEQQTRLTPCVSRGGRGTLVLDL